MRPADSQRGDRLQLHLALHAAEPTPDRREGEISGDAQEDLPGGVAAYSLPGPLPVSQRPPAYRLGGHFSPCWIRLKY